MDEPEPRLDSEHAYYASQLWPEISASIPTDLHVWLGRCLQHAWVGEKTIALLMLEHPGTRRYHWQIAGVEFCCEKADFLPRVKSLCVQFGANVPPEHALPLDALPLGAGALQKKRWDVHLKDGGVVRVAEGPLPDRLLGDACSHVGCAQPVCVMGWLRNRQLTEEDELEVLRGKWTAAVGISDVRYYCADHVDCNREARLEPDRPCRGPLALVTTRLAARELASGDELDGHLLCLRHSPPAPRHMLFAKKV